jgi:hypothetical protein
MEIDTNLPVPELKDLHTYRNRQTGKIEQIDLRTGKMYEPYLPMRKSEFCNTTADLICNAIREGDSLKHICEENNIPQSVFYAWLSLYPEFRMRYQDARVQRAEYHFHKAVDTAETALSATKDEIPGIKVVVDTHKWAAEKSDPERYGTRKTEIEINQPSVIVLNTGIDREGAPSIEELLRKKEPVTVEAEVIQPEVISATEKGI